MVKANSHHGLDRKYKPWRRGKSQNAKAKKGSLKQQLRGLTRLLPKAHDEEHKEKIQQQIKELQTQIDDKQAVEHQKSNARKSHGVRFLERQRLTRMWQNAIKLADADQRQQEQYRIGLDMLYVAHYPLEVRYQPLFRKNQRILLDGRNLARRAAARSKLFQSIVATTLPRMAWIPAQVYENIPDSWSNDLERQTFGVVAPTSAPLPAVSDDRFANAANDHESILQAAQAMDAALDAEEAEEEEPKDAKKSADHESSSSDGVASDDDDDDDDDDSDGADPLAQNQDNRKRPIGDAIESEPSKQQSAVKNESSEESSSSDDSSSSSDDDDDDSSNSDEPDAKETAKPPPTSDKKPDDDDDDDFLVAPEEASATNDIFANAKEMVPSVDQARGDKSQGWSTQRQRPGQFKKPRTRR